MSGVGDLPSGFEIVREGALLLAARSDVRSRVVPLVRRWATDALPEGARALAGGRGGVCAFDLDGLGVVLRPYRRGGWMARVTRDLYVGWRPRPVCELAVTEALRVRGVPTLEVLAAAVLRVNWFWYRGALVTREVAGARNLWQELVAIDCQERPRLCAAVASVTRLLHDAGAIHPDLNLQNYLVRRTGALVEVLVIDHDRTRFGRVTPKTRQAAWARVQRSTRRLDPRGAVVTPECLAALRAIGDEG